VWESRDMRKTYIPLQPASQTAPVTEALLLLAVIRGIRAILYGLPESNVFFWCPDFGLQ